MSYPPLVSPWPWPFLLCDCDGACDLKMLPNVPSAALEHTYILATVRVPYLTFRCKLAAYWLQRLETSGIDDLHRHRVCGAGRVPRRMHVSDLDRDRTERTRYHVLHTRLTVV